MANRKIYQYIDYIEENKKEILECKRKINEIKHKKEWIKAINYLRTMKYLGVIDETPQETNNYRKPIVLSDSFESEDSDE